MQVSEPLQVLTCGITPNDFIEVRIGTGHGVSDVLLMSRATDGRNSKAEVLIVASPSRARAFAAAVLNAADEAEGKQPLVFMPPGPTAGRRRWWRKAKR